ncbi:2-polyprenylphenol 6-hydroxylase [Telmatospirillum siberiense]|uniref:2-polyprenylphenol 6-hydroxylase n=1 Tax=Telmatospirillum siberiense TaxID=382514 RepID=A0A2N3PSH9_9PROT|nr:2-polyprenylphenol 6-hydroxylase [Telmatospirillum siberiense]PKU23352.1 2-polyprenylphenol 6-hydroxylase [Telmatospirillum siberiense]
MFRVFRNLLRLASIGRALTRHDALFLIEVTDGGRLLAKILHPFADSRYASLRPGQRLAAALQMLGPTFVKFGQALSTRADLVGDEVAADLSELQDRLAPFPAAAARAIVAAELGQPVEALYRHFEDEPVAAASIAQVHLAVTSDGEEVAVKVLRPGVEQKFARDIALFYWLAGWVERLLPSMRRLRFVDSVHAFEDSVIMEMDLRFEAAAAAEMADNFADDPTFTIPTIDWQRTAHRVLTMERIHGISIDEVEVLMAAGHDRVAIVEKAADAFFNMVFRDGFFHADMHPGNLFVGENGQLIAVDFGITGRVDKQTRRFLGEMLLGFLNGDYRRVAEVHFEAGFVPPDKSIDAFAQACRSFAEPLLGRPLHEISIARLLGQLFEVTETFAMEVQPQLLLLQKSMLVAEGVGRRLDPQINMWQLARPLIEQWMTSNLGPQARVMESVSAMVASFESLPRLVSHAEKTVEALRNGGLKLHPESIRSLQNGGRRSGLFPTWLPWVLVVGLTALLLRR